MAQLPSKRGSRLTTSRGWARLLFVLFTARYKLSAAQSPITFPGCTLLQDSQFATDPDFSIFYDVYEQHGFNTLLKNLKDPATLFIMHDDARSAPAHNVTLQDCEDLGLFPAALEYHIVPNRAFMEPSEFEDGEVLTTLYSGANLTVYLESGNSTEGIIIESYGADVMIDTPIYACYLVIYGVDGGFQPTFAVPFDSSLLGQKFQFYLEYAPVPGRAEVPAQLIIDAVAAGDVHAVAGAFGEALQAGYTQQLVHILQKGITNPSGFQALASVANEMIQQTTCNALRPLIRDLYAFFPTFGSLHLTTAQGSQIKQGDPQLATCIMTSIA